MNAARYPSQSTTEPTVNTNQQPQDAPKPMIIEKATERKFLMEKRKKNKVSKHLRRDGNKKEMKSFTKRILRIHVDVPFYDAYWA
ncbi:hypothetical protein YC2023_076275 [Brassica napus]